MKSLPPLRVVVGPVGGTSTRAIIARIDPDFTMPAFVSAFSRATKLSQSHAMHFSYGNNTYE